MAITSDFSDPIFGVTLQPDGKMLVAGQFATVLGLRRIDADSAIDPGFQSPYTLGTVHCSAVQPDGRILVGTGVRRLQPEDLYIGFGRIDNAGIIDITYQGPSTDAVFAQWIQDDGKVLLGGSFTSADKPRYMLRLTETGAVDRTFLPRVDGVNSAIHTMTVQADGKILIGGTFTRVAGVSRPSLARLLPTGALDSAFNARMGADRRVSAMAVQADGRIVIGGAFSTAGGQPRRGLARLNPDGSVDPSFTATVDATDFATEVSSVQLQVDGNILVAGRFASINGTPRRGVARLMPDGTVDPGFNAGATDGGFVSLALQGDGRIVAAGLAVIPNQPRYRQLFRLANDPAVDELKAVSAQRIEWVRGGTAPESNLVTFALAATEQGPWTELGRAGRRPDGWELTGTSLPTSGWLRARARVQTGLGNGSFGFVESVAAFTRTPEIAVFDGPNVDAPPVLSGQATAVSFGTTRQGTSLIRTLILANEGSDDLVIDSVIVPAGFSVVDFPPIPATLAAGTTMALDLRLEATAPGAISGPVVIGTNDADEPRFTFPVAGTVVTPEIAVHDGATTSDPELTAGQSELLSFGRVVQGSPTGRFFTVANSGDAPLLVNRVTVPAGFRVAEPPIFPQVAQIGGSLAIQILLDSLEPRTHEGVVTIESDDLDEASFSFTVGGEIFIPVPLVSFPEEGTRLNRQTGLREQTIRFSNDTTAQVPGYRIVLSGLPFGVEVANASATLPDGSVIVLILEPLTPFSHRDIIIEYASIDRRPIAINPAAIVEVVLSPPNDAVTEDDGTVEVDRIQRLGEREVLIEFTSKPAREYEIHYSPDGREWRASPTRIRAAGNRTQWIDRGPPRTDQAPVGDSRFYRILDLSPR